MDVRDAAISTFEQYFGVAPEFMVRSPGRVNLLGEHVDYNDGFVFPAAINRYTFLAFSPSLTPVSMLLAVDLEEQVSFTRESAALKKDVNGLPLPAWALYPAGVMHTLAQDRLSTPGINAVYSSTIPRGSGLSSSASVEMAFVLAWQTVGEWTLSTMERALLGQKAENDYVGVQCGIMDQFACACGQLDRLLFLDCRTLEWQTLPLPDDIAIVVADTTIRRSLMSGAYNQRRQDCEEALRILRIDLPGIKALRDVSLAEFNRFAHKLPERVQKRARHVVEEIERSYDAVSLLESGQIAKFGQLLYECHTSLRDLYEVSIPELDTMVNLAQSIEGCWGARLTGAGFGGCTVNLVSGNQVEKFVKTLITGYRSATGLEAEIYVCTASDGARLI